MAILTAIRRASSRVSNRASATAAQEGAQPYPERGVHFEPGSHWLAVVVIFVLEDIRFTEGRALVRIDRGIRDFFLNLLRRR